MKVSLGLKKVCQKFCEGLRGGGGPPWLGNFVAKNSLSSKILELKKFLGNKKLFQKKLKFQNFGT